MYEKHLILWDGECGLCRRASQWFCKHDKTGLLTASPYQEAPTPPMTPELHAACEFAVHIVLKDGKILRAGRATLFLFSCVGWGIVCRFLALPPFLWGVEWLYRIVANNRPFFARFCFTHE